MPDVALWLDPPVTLDREFCVFASRLQATRDSSLLWSMSVCPVVDGSIIAAGPECGDQESLDLHPAIPGTPRQVLLAAIRLVTDKDGLDPAVFDWSISEFSRWFKRQFPWGILVRGETPLRWDWSTSRVVADRRIRFGYPLVPVPPSLLAVPAGEGEVPCSR